MAVKTRLKSAARDERTENPRRRVPAGVLYLLSNDSAELPKPDKKRCKSIETCRFAICAKTTNGCLEMYTFPNGQKENLRDKKLRQKRKKDGEAA